MHRNVMTLILITGFAAGARAQQPPQKSIDVGDIDRSAQPCNDFFEYSNGAWRAHNPIPESMDRWSRRWKAGEENKYQLRDILTEVSASADHPKGSTQQLIGDFYAACMDTKAIDAAGLEPLEPYLRQIDAIHDRAGLEQEINALEAMGISAPFGFSSAQNPHAPAEVISDVGAGGLGLPDRDYYIKPDQRFVDARAGYLVYVAKLFALAGASDADAKTAADTVMKFETSLAQASFDNVTMRDPHATDHVESLDDLEKMTPGYNWRAYLDGAHVVPGLINIDQPKFMAELERQLDATPIAEWKTYLRWRLLDSEAARLATPYEDARFDFFQRQLAGVSVMKPRAVRCAEQTDALLGEALGQEYVKRYFPPAAKQRAKEMVANILSAMHDTIESVDWMAPETKQKALNKLATFNVKVGYPDKWKDYSSVTIHRDNYFADSVAGVRFLVADDLATINKPVDRGRWGMTPPTSNAYYNPLLNEIVFPAGILQPPAFSVDYVDARNYGEIGVVMGHEISHGFDDQGAQFDGTGKLENWWTPVDLEKFHAKTACVAHQFDGYRIDGPDDIHLNGKLVLGESIADLGGLKLAYLAFKKTAQGQSMKTIDGFTPDQQFFIAWGQFRGDETRPATQKLMVQGDPHPVAKYRVLGPTSNFPPFSQAFSCKAGDAMVRPDADRCVVW